MLIIGSSYLTALFVGQLNGRYCYLIYEDSSMKNMV